MYPDTPPGPPLHPPVSHTDPHDAPGGSIAVKINLKLKKINYVKFLNLFLKKNSFFWSEKKKNPLLENVWAIQKYNFFKKIFFLPNLILKNLGQNTKLQAGAEHLAGAQLRGSLKIKTRIRVIPLAP